MLVNVFLTLLAIGLSLAFLFGAIAAWGALTDWCLKDRQKAIARKPVEPRKPIEPKELDPNTFLGKLFGSSKKEAPDPYRVLSKEESWELEGDKPTLARITPLTKYERICAKEYVDQSKSYKDLDGKAEIVNKLWEGRVPGYLWFDMGKVKNKKEVVSEKGLQEIKDIFFPNNPPGFGDIEFHECYWLPKNTVLRVRGADVFELEPVIDGKKLILYQVGYGDFREEYFNFWRVQFLRDQIEKFAPNK